MTKKRQTVKYPIKISDWLLFLENETNYNFRIMVFIATAILVATIGLYSLPEKSIWVFLAVPFILVAFYFLARKISRKSALIQKLIDDIIEGKITDPKKIREKWLTDIKPKIRISKP